MSVHFCNRDTCSTKAVGGPKMNCVECDKECFLLCYGFEKSGQGGVKLPLSSGACIGIDPNLISITCSNCDNILIDDAVAFKMESMAGKSKAVKSKPDTNSQETQTFHPNITMIRMADDLADLKSTVEEMKRKMDEPRSSSDNLLNLAALPSCSNNSPSSNNKAKISFADILRADRQIRTPKRNKDSMIAKKLVKNKIVHQPPKVGTRIDIDNLVIVADVIPRPTFNKSIYVSRVGTSVSHEKMVSYIEKHSDMKKNINFKCSLLVKKEADLSTLTFVSYKIDVTEESFDHLMLESFWPKGIQIRPFVPKEKKSVEFGDFLNSSVNESDHPNKIPRASHLNEEVLQTNIENTGTDQIKTNAVSDLMDFRNMDLHIKAD